MGRLILVEGIPGSGKTTISRKIADYLSEYRETNYYEEGDSHPADLAWCACIPEDQFEKIIREYPVYEASMKQVMYRESGYVIVPYTRFPIEDPSFYKLMESYEVYDNRVGLDAFVELHKKKWISFGENAKSVDEYTVFECAYLQNHINELLLYHCIGENEIKKYLNDLINPVLELKPVMIYLGQPEIHETLRRVSNSRVNEKGEKVWMERVIEYIEASPYGKLNHLQGFDGMVTYFSERKRIEYEVMKSLPIEIHIIESSDYNWEQIWTEIETIVGQLVNTSFS